MFYILQMSVLTVHVILGLVSLNLGLETEKKYKKYNIHSL